MTRHAGEKPGPGEGPSPGDGAASRRTPSGAVDPRRLTQTVAVSSTTSSQPAGGSASDLPLEAELIERISWFITLRWLAVAGMLLGPGIARWIPGLDVPVLLIQGVGSLVALYNVFFRVRVNRLDPSDPAMHDIVHRCAGIQILADWIALTALIQHTGGITSPLLFFYFFHTILACIFLDVRSAWLQATVAVLLVAGVAGLEAAGILTHHPLFRMLPVGIYRQPIYVGGVLAGFAFAIYGTVYLGTSVVRGLREKDRRIVEAERATKEAYRELAEVDQQRTEFLRRITHELRAPINGAESMLTLLMEGYMGELTENQADLFARIRQRIVHLRHLVKDLLDLARGETAVHTRPREQVDLLPLLDELCRRFVPEAESRGLTMTYRLPPRPVLLYADPQDIEGLIGNLVSNALKYTPEGGRIELEADIVDDTIRIRVSDTGIGIPKEDQERLFQQFFRAENARRLTEEGTGLGLMIIKRILDRYDGTIEVESEPGRGTTFTVTIPLPYCELPQQRS